MVPSRGRPRHLDACLRALLMQTRKPDQVVLMLRESDLASRSVVEGWRHHAPFPVTVRLVRNTGGVDAIRAGVDAAVGDVVALTGDDAVPRSNWLERLGWHYRQPEVGGVGGREVLHWLDDTVQGTAGEVGRLAWYGPMLGRLALSRGGVCLVDLLKGVNFSLRRELWMLDPHLRGCGDDQPMWELAVCLRLRRQGWKLVYDPSAVVDRYPMSRPGGTHPTSAARCWVVAYNETLAILRWGSWRQKLAFWAHALLVGGRSRPGLLAGLALLGQGEPPGGVATAVACSLRGRLAAAGAWMGERVAGLA
ncbi:MAG TPA: glycosyltransferase family A protein [Candidatus Dormibacteraeota bacterium]|nr:glycosyltransferase family A protein [Candidatus Dormibacteraeota bacterium]